MPNRCVAYGCKKSCKDNVSLFKFPRDPAEFRTWEKQVQRTRSNWTAKPTSRLCSEHFSKDCFDPKPPAFVRNLLPRHCLKLREGAVPTVFIRPPCPSCGGDTKDCSVCSRNGKRFRVTMSKEKLSVEPKDRTPMPKIIPTKFQEILRQSSN